MFDMENDPEESTNLYGKYPELIESLKKQLADIIETGRSSPGEPQRNDPMKKGEEWAQIDPVTEYLN